jgi:hypothetical protein
MQLSNAPSKLIEAFAINGNKNTIPVNSQIGVVSGAASYNDGFPPLTMTDPDEGGVPPSGLDFNGIFFALSATDVWYCCGAGFPYDGTFATQIGGYPKGSQVLAASGSGYWFCTVDNNTSNPDAGGAGWELQGFSALAGVYASAQQTLNPGSFPGSAKVIFDTVEFDNGLWDSANKRFKAPQAGKYRISGAIMLNAPGGQNLTLLIFKGGAPVRQCFEAPQVSTGNLTLPFSAIVTAVTNDYFEVFVGMDQSAVLAGVNGNNQVFVFAQCEFLGT